MSRVKIQKWYQVVNEENETIDNFQSYQKALKCKKEYLLNN